MEACGETYEILHPEMPHPDYPKYKAWKSSVKKAFVKLRDDVLLIGHSLGGSVLLKFLSEEASPVPVRIAGLFLIAAPYWGKKDWEVQEFALREDFAAKLPSIPVIHLYHSRGDEFVPSDHVKEYKKRLPQAGLHEFGGNDHIFLSGLPELVQDVKNASKHGRSV